MTAKIIKPEAEWRRQLSDEQFEVTRHKATERPFSGKYNDCKDAGTYNCVCCGASLFSSSHKFDSGSGWPSYWQPVAPDAVKTAED
ncbi:MAG: peptide-methionine (R)-S-oxide reductase, partial [Giesbergeria sp.]